MAAKVLFRCFFVVAFLLVLQSAALFIGVSAYGQGLVGVHDDVDFCGCHSAVVQTNGGSENDQLRMYVGLSAIASTGIAVWFFNSSKLRRPKVLGCSKRSVSQYPPLRGAHRSKWVRLQAIFILLAIPMCVQLCGTWYIDNFYYPAGAFDGL